MQIALPDPRDMVAEFELLVYKRIRFISWFPLATRHHSRGGGFFDATQIRFVVECPFLPPKLALDQSFLRGRASEPERQIFTLSRRSEL